MKIWGLDESQIRDAAATVGVGIWGDYSTGTGGIRRDGRALRVRLKVNPFRPRDDRGRLPWQKLGYGGRRTAYINWEGHRNFIAQCFRLNPEARVKTGLADYKGKENFLATFRSTREFNRNSIIRRSRTRAVAQRQLSQLLGVNGGPGWNHVISHGSTNTSYSYISNPITNSITIGGTNA